MTRPASDPGFASAVPTLVLLPGLACDEALWRHQIGPLAALGPVAVGRAHQTLAHQTLAHQSPSYPAPAHPTPVDQPSAETLPAMARLLLQQHPGRLALAGCSMGGMLALEVWRQAPQRVAGLALLGTTARPDTEAMKALRTEAITLFAQGRAQAVLQANAMLVFHRSHAGRLTDDYLAMVMRAGTAGLIRQNRAVMARDDLRPVLPGVTCPTLVVGGLDDTLTPPERQREIADAVPGARLHLLATCGHMPTWEQPEAVTRLLLDWRQGLQAPAGPAASDQARPGC